MLKLIRVIYIFVMVLLFSCKHEVKKETTGMLIKKAVLRYDKHFLKVPYVAQASYMEKAKYNGAYCMFTEGYGYLLSSGYNCPIPIDNFSFLFKNIRKSDRKKGWLATLKYTYKDKPVKSQSDVPPGYNSLFSSFRFLEKNGPLNIGNITQYNFVIEDTFKTTKRDSDLVKVNFRPVAKNDKRYVGSFFIERRSGFIKRIELKDTQFYSENFRRWLSANGQIRYSKQDKSLYLSSASFHFKNEGIEYWVSFSSSQPIIYNDEIKKEDFNKLVFNDRNPFVIFNPQNWNNVSFIINEYDYIEKQLGIRKSISQQYYENANQPFYKITLFNNHTITVEGGTKTYDFIRNKIKSIDNLF